MSKKGGNAKMKKYKKLRTKIFDLDYSQAELCRRIGKSQTYLSMRFQGKKPFELDVMYEICDILKIPYEELHIYFPKNDYVKHTT